ncbi:hypothetical protein GOODEAATRI_032005 [Goodea atripinnis]|uniref:RPAP1 C-terminal domain-containing protein n=1 Tax=Goodea atripinnis TaxID=208336 RepID=A0ABV0NFF9_9TELE
MTSCSGFALFPQRAGYSLQELFLLSRSQLIQQRSLALNTLACILTKVHKPAHTVSCIPTEIPAETHSLILQARAGEYQTILRGSVTSTSFPLLPSAQEEDEGDEGLNESMKETAMEKEERKSDYDVARQDVVKGLLKMKLLPRLRYVLEVVRPSPRVVEDVLHILTRVARHSSSSATQVLDCPRLMETVLSEFLPTSWKSPSSLSLLSAYGHPVANAMKLVRVLATSGRHANCANKPAVILKVFLLLLLPQLNSLGVRERLSCLLSAEPNELLMDPNEALRITTEAYRMWAVAAGYGQACQLYM